MIAEQVDVQKKPDPKGDRVVLTFECVASLVHDLYSKRRSGKFLPYNPW